MKILQLIDSLHSGGAERMCVNIANVLYEKGHEVILCATREGGPLEKAISPGVSYFILHKKNTFDLKAFARLISTIKSNGVEVIHAHSSSLFWAVMAKFFVRNIKVIWHDHLGLKVTDRKSQFLYKKVSSRVDAIIAVNNELLEWSFKNMKVPADRITMINNFPLLNVVRRPPDPEFFTIVCLANLRPQKDHKTLVKAVVNLARHDLPKKLRVIFAGAIDDKKYYEEVKKLINDLGLNDVIAMPGSVEDTASLLAGADCGVLSSVSEGLPVALLEYGIAALPVVVTDVGQCAEVVGNGLYGKIVAPRDANALSNDFFWILYNYNEAVNIGKSFQEHVKNNYGVKRFIKNYTDLLYIINRG